MKKITQLSILIIICMSSAFAQTDTIYTNTERISCSVKEVTQDAVKFIYPGEEIINTVYKNTVQKIVFKSGRVQTFAEATSYKTVRGANDFENVTMTSVQSEVNGLFKMGDVSAKAKGTTVYASMEKVKERAYKKMKIVAAMMGANIVYLTSNLTAGNQYGGYYQAGKATETNVSGVAYSNKLPSFDEFNKLVGNKTAFNCVERFKMSQRDPDLEQRDYNKPVQILKVYNESGLTMVNATIEGVDNNVFRVIGFTNEEFTLVWKDGERIYNYRIKV
jgi:hypothetical protein